MAMLESKPTNAVPFGAITTHRVIGALDGLYRQMLGQWRRRRAERTLRQLTDHQLTDIGLHRGSFEDRD